MGETTLRQALEEYQSVYLPARNLAARTRREYLDDLDDLVGFLENNSGIKRVGSCAWQPLSGFWHNWKSGGWQDPPVSARLSLSGLS